MQCFEDFGLCTKLRGKPETLSVDDRLEVKQRALKQLVDYNEVELLDVGYLKCRVLQSQRDDLG